MSEAKWTFMVYMAGDNNLASAGEADLAEMRRVGSSAEVNVVVQFDNAGACGTSRYLVQRNGRDLLQSLGPTDSGDPQVLLDFVAWAWKEYPSQRSALILWNHGGGWEPAEMDRIARAVHAPDYGGRESVARSRSRLGRVFFRTTLEKILSLPTANERAICSDDGSGHSLDTVELGQVLAQVKAVIGHPLDLLGMDACLMSNLEVAYQARSYARYMVASEESEPNEGWPYEALLGKLSANPDLPTAELCAHIVNAYIQFYIAQGVRDPVTQTALDLSRLDALTAPLDALADAVIGKLPGSRAKVVEAQWDTALFYDTLGDIADFCGRLGQRAKRTPVRPAAQAVVGALQPGADRLVFAESHRGAAVGRCAGVTIYLPDRRGISRYYADLTYAQEHRWLAMLRAMRS